MHAARLRNYSCAAHATLTHRLRACTRMRADAFTHTFAYTHEFAARTFERTHIIIIINNNNNNNNNCCGCVRLHV